MNRIKIFLSFLTFLIFFGCSIPTDFYIQNLTNDIKTIRIKYNIKLVNDFNNDSSETHRFYYKNGIINPKDFKGNKKGELKVLEKSIESDSIIVLKLFPKSTTRIVKTQNYRWLNWLIENIEIDNEKIEIKKIASKSKRIKKDYLYLIE
jgi:uncharacterized membrane protein